MHSRNSHGPVRVKGQYFWQRDCLVVSTVASHQEDPGLGLVSLSGVCIPSALCGFSPGIPVFSHCPKHAS